MSSSRTFPFISDPSHSNIVGDEGGEMKETINIPFYNCPDDYDFLYLLENETWSRLEERFEWLKLKFRILNAKSFNRQMEGGSFFNNFLFADLRYYPCLLSWHFEDCAYVNFSSMMMKMRNSFREEYNNKNDTDDDDDYYEGAADDEKESSCQCALGLKDPDEKIKRNASSVSEKWCMDGSILNICRIKNEYFAMYRSGINDKAIRDRYFGYGFNSGDESLFSEEMRRWSSTRLALMRNYIALRLRLVNFMKTVKKYNLPMDFYGLKITNGKWHVKACTKTNPDEICECGLAFDHPKGWFRYFCNINNIGETGYALIAKPIFRDSNYMY